MRARRTATALTTLALLAGCAASPVVLRADDVLPATQGRQYDTVATWPGGSPETGYRYPAVLLPDGSAIGVEVPANHVVGDVFEAPSRVGVMSGDEFTSFGDTSGILPGHGLRGVVEVAHEDGVTVWTESPSIQGSPLWRLFIHDDTGTRLLTTEEEVTTVAPDAAAWGVSGLAFVDGRVTLASRSTLVSVAADGTDLRADPLPEDAVPEVEILTTTDAGVELVVAGPDGEVRVEGAPPVAGVVACGERYAWLVAGATDDEAQLMVLDPGAAELWQLGAANRWGAILCAGDLLSFGRPGDVLGGTVVIRWTAA